MSVGSALLVDCIVDVSTDDVFLSSCRMGVSPFQSELSDSDLSCTSSDVEDGVESDIVCRSERS